MEETAAPALALFQALGSAARTSRLAMAKTKDLTQRIAGKAKQAVGEIIGDQDLHDEGREQAERGHDDLDKSSQLNALKKFKQLT